MTSREIIRRVLEFDNPPRIGFTYSAYDGQPRLSDTVGMGPTGDPEFEERRWLDDDGGEQWTDEWGCTWRRIVGRTKGGEVVVPAIKTWEDLDTYRPATLGDSVDYTARQHRAEKPQDRGGQPLRK